MWLKQISVLNFKNYTESNLQFISETNAFTGVNGAGKTNLLDAIHYLSLCKSYFNPIDSQHIRTGEDWFMVQGTFDKETKQQDIIACSLKRNQKKQFKRNKKEYPRLADHIGLFPLVMISPYDSIIVTDGSEERRKFIDNAISQTDNNYLEKLIDYNRILLHRNQLLKTAAKNGQLDLNLVEIYNEQLVVVGNEIFQKRVAFLQTFIPHFDRHYHYLVDDSEEVQLKYESPLLHESFDQLLKQNLEKDRALERTSQGIHKDDLIFTIHGEMSLKKFGSQGQQKTFLIALKLAQYSYLKERKGFSPLLLLDDIFEKLDDHRTKKLMKMVSDETFGQIFLTDTNATRIKNIFTEIDRPIRIFEVTEGAVNEK